MLMQNYLRQMKENEKQYEMSITLTSNKKERAETLSNTDSAQNRARIKCKLT